MPMLEGEFEAQVFNGQLVPSEQLRQFEGQRVHVALSSQTSSTSMVANDAAQAEPPNDFDVEKDVAVRMAFLSKTITNPTIIQGSGLKPCLIFPLESSDD